MLKIIKELKEEILNNNPFNLVLFAPEDAFEVRKNIFLELDVQQTNFSFGVNQTNAACLILLHGQKVNLTWYKNQYGQTCGIQFTKQ